MSARPPAYVAVVGPSGGADDLLQTAYEVGRGLAMQQALLVCGGLGGIMAAACRGALDAGGRTLGLLPGLDRRAANPWVTAAVATGLGEARNALVVQTADAVVALGGGWGTLSEIALAIRLGKPVVGVRTWRPEPPPGTAAGQVVEVLDAADAVRSALQLAAGC